MARDRQQERSRNESSTNSTPVKTEASRSATDRERSIAPERERAGTRDQITRPYTGAVQGVGASPFGLMRRMADDMDRLFDQLGLGRFGSALHAQFPLVEADILGRDRQALWSPQLEVLERDSRLVIRADLPGLEKDDVNVEVEDGVLTISGERKQEREENREGYYRSERSYGRFYRAIPLPETVNAEQCNASFNNGVLEVSFPVQRQELKRAKRIPVR